jgi:ABC-type branched-subunit amino acid transport system ATPase component
MLAVVRALMAAPRRLLMDEPSAGLAPLVVDQRRWVRR